MNKWILAAAALSGLTVVAHVFGGGPEFHGPLLESELSDHVKAGFSIIWHFTTLAMTINTALLIFGARNPTGGRAVVWGVIAQYFAFALLFLFYGLTRLGNMTELPQWTAFLLMAILAGIGLKRQVK